MFLVREEQREGRGRAPRAAEPAPLAEESPALAAPALQLEAGSPAQGVKVPREELAAEATPTSDGPASSTRLLGRLVAPETLVFDEKHALGNTQMIWTLFPPPGAEADAESALLLDYPDDDGRFELTDVPPGRRVELALTPPIGPEQTFAFEPLAAGELRRVELVLDPGATIAGVVRAADGLACAGVTLVLDDLRRSDLATLDDDELNRACTRQTDENGAFSFTELPRCRWSLRLQVSRSLAALDLDTSAGDVRDLLLVTPPPAELVVEVRWPDGVNGMAALAASRSTCPCGASSSSASKSCPARIELRKRARGGRGSLRASALVPPWPTRATRRTGPRRGSSGRRTDPARDRARSRRGSGSRRRGARARPRRRLPRSSRRSARSASRRACGR